MAVGCRPTSTLAAIIFVRGSILTISPSPISSGRAMTQIAPSPAARREGRGSLIRVTICCDAGLNRTTVLSSTEASHRLPSPSAITAEGKTGSGALLLTRFERRSMPTSASRALLEVTQTEPLCMATAPRHKLHERASPGWILAETLLVAGSTREIEPSRSLGTQTAELSAASPADGAAPTGMIAATLPTEGSVPHAASSRPTARNNNIERLTHVRMRVGQGRTTVPSRRRIGGQPPLYGCSRKGHLAA